MTERQSGRSTPRKRRPRRHAEHGYGVFPLVVSRVRRLSESFVRISLTGASLRYAAEEIATGSGGLQDAYVKVLIPPPGRTEPTRIALTSTWRHDWFSLPEETRGWMRTYTLRASRLRTPAASTEALPSVPDLADQYSADLKAADLPEGQHPEVDLDFVLHGEAAGGGTEAMGPASSWAARAQPGDYLSILAPLGGQPLWASWDAADAREITLIVDETAVPAALSILSDYVGMSRSPSFSRQHAPRLHLLAQVPYESDTLESLWSGAYPHLGSLKDADLDMQVTWLVRGAQEGQEDALEAQLRNILGIAEDCSPPAGLSAASDFQDHELVWGVADSSSCERYIFIAGEASRVKRLRRICVQQGGIPKTDVSFMGYWRVGKTES